MYIIVMTQCLQWVNQGHEKYSPWFGGHGFEHISGQTWVCIICARLTKHVLSWDLESANINGCWLGFGFVYGTHNKI